MAILSGESRARIWRGLMRYWSKLREPCSVDKAALLAAVEATDVWIDENAASFNSALPAVARSGLTTAQKTLLLCAVALVRAGSGMGALLRRALGVEVD
jgi:hypothetical protein